MKEIPLTQGKIALVDDEDYDRVMQYKWCYEGYAVRRQGTGKQKLSNFIVEMPNSVMLDHKDRNPLNYQRSNLRQCTRFQNAQNSTKPVGPSNYRGVSRHKSRWQVRIQVNSKCRFLGYFNDPVIAAQVYDEAAKELHGEFAVLNFPYEEETK
jgi:hypothetical protein